MIDSTLEPSGSSRINDEYIKDGRLAVGTPRWLIAALTIVFAIVLMVNLPAANILNIQACLVVISGVGLIACLVMGARSSKQ